MKKVCAAAFVLMFVASTASMSFAAKVKCEVTEVNEADGMVMLKCEKPDKFKAGDKLKVSTAKKGAAVEGC
ncbi:MAG: hypothetical protein HKP52_07615 [Desulfofustis sp.]|nr:hypothetical protein [Desulfofustis sp.]RZW20371.1 MAG: hypothetical protein EX260_06730 [Desulfobulbaceae bacterium]MBT8353222.1 hypothetical protein [Desulfofustis sp.]NNF47150.1 hypothetical protein [Desulfofustis sp.]NNK14088.1 hypothetical protein [Desulfofustis sp.]